MNKSEFNMEIEDFVKFPESDVDPEAPQISLELTVRPELYLDAPFTIWSTLRYEPSEQETEDHPVTVQWDLAETNRNLILLRQTANGFEKVEIQKDEPQIVPKQEEIKQNGHKQDQVNGDQVKPGKVKTNGVHHKEVKQDEPMPDQPSQPESKQDTPIPAQLLPSDSKPSEPKEDQLMPDPPKLWQPTTTQETHGLWQPPTTPAHPKQNEPIQEQTTKDEPTWISTSSTQDQLMPDRSPQESITPSALVEEPEDISTPTPNTQPTLKISLSNPDLTSLTLSFPTPPSTTNTISTSSITTQTIRPYIPIETLSSLPRSYIPFVRPGNTYVLVFPGCVVPLLGEEGKGEGIGGGRKEVVIPGTWTTEFEVRQSEKAIVPVPEEEELFVPTRLGRANTVPSFRMSFHE